MADLSTFEINNTTYNFRDSAAHSDIATINGKIPSSASSSNKLLTATERPDLGFYLDNDGDLCQN